MSFHRQKQSKGMAFRLCVSLRGKLGRILRLREFPFDCSQSTRMNEFFVFWCVLLWCVQEDLYFQAAKTHKHNLTGKMKKNLFFPVQVGLIVPLLRHLRWSKVPLRFLPLRVAFGTDLVASAPRRKALYWNSVQWTRPLDLDWYLQMKWTIRTRNANWYWICILAWQSKDTSTSTGKWKWIVGLFYFFQFYYIVNKNTRLVIEKSAVFGLWFGWT